MGQPTHTIAATQYDPRLSRGNVALRRNMQLNAGGRW